MRILLLGGTGFIGPRVVRRLTAAGHDIAVFHRGQTAADLPVSVRHILGDREELPARRNELAKFAPEVAIDMRALTERDARGMLRRLRAAAILEGSGARGAGAADLDATVAILGRFSQLCLDLRDHVAAIDINPLIVFPRGQGARVVDCLVIPAGEGD